MATPSGQAEQAAPKRPAVEFLRRFLDMAEKGEITGVVLGYIKADGGAAVQSTPMSAVMMNHLSKLLDRRVDREYDRAIAQASAPPASTGARTVPDKSRVEAHLPRNVRRLHEKNLQKLQKKAVKGAKKKQAVEQVVRAPAPAPAPPQNGAVAK